MAESVLSLSSGFETATEADWLSAVEKALRGGGLERITRTTRDGLKVKPLYRETDFESSTNPRGMPGDAPYLRGAHGAPDAYLPWDIRQEFAHPDPATTNTEILRDLERGVSSIELTVECSGKAGCIVCSHEALATALQGVRGDIATIALNHSGAGSGTSAAALLAHWAMKQDRPVKQRLAFNIDPFGTLVRIGKVSGGLDAAFARCAELTQVLALKFPAATALRVDARPIHEAGGTEAQELGGLIAHAVDMLRRLSAAGLPLQQGAAQILFTLAVDGNYGMGIAKLRTARRLWARVLEALGLEPAPMRLQAVTSARMLSRYDPWVNMLRGTAACFAAATGGADVVTVRPFNEALGVPEELGRRIARNTQIIAMEESDLGRVADPSGGAWFTETLSEDLAQAAWAEFQAIEAEGGYGESLIKGALQARISEARKALLKDVARRKVPITGVSEFPLLDGAEAPVATFDSPAPRDGIDGSALQSLIPTYVEAKGADSVAEPLVPMRLAEPFEVLRDRAEAHHRKTSRHPSIFLATLGPLAEHTARADFARNLFAAGGIEAKAAPVPPKGPSELAAAFKASGCQIAVLCGSDARYDAEASEAAKTLKAAGVVAVWLAGKNEAEGVDRHIFMGCDVVHELTVALAELGVK